MWCVILLVIVIIVVSVVIERNCRWVCVLDSSRLKISVSMFRLSMVRQGQLVMWNGRWVLLWLVWWCRINCDSNEIVYISRQVELMMLSSIGSICFGNSSFIIVVVKLNSMLVSIVMMGIWCGLVYLSMVGVLWCCVSENIMCEVLYRLVLSVDSSVIIVIRVMVVVVLGILVIFSIVVNGDLSSLLVYGIMVMIMFSELMQNIRMCQVMVWIVCVMLCLGFLVFVVVIVMILVLLKVNIIISRVVLMLVSFVGVKLLCVVKLFRFGDVILGSQFSSSVVLIRMNVMIVIILRIVNQNLNLLKFFIFSRLIVVKNIMKVSVVIGIEIIGYIVVSRFVVLIVLVVIMIISCIYYNQFIVVLVVVFIVLVVYIENVLLVGLVVVILFSVFIMMIISVLVIRQDSSIVGLVVCMFMLELRNRFVLIVLFKFIMISWWGLSVWFRWVLVGEVVGVGVGDVGIGIVWWVMSVI